MHTTVLKGVNYYTFSHKWLSDSLLSQFLVISKVPFIVKWAVDNLNVPYILKEQQTESVLT